MFKKPDSIHQNGQHEEQRRRAETHRLEVLLAPGPMSTGVFPVPVIQDSKTVATNSRE